MHEDTERPGLAAREAAGAAYHETVDEAIADGPSSREAEISEGGTFANGVTAATVIQFILDHDETASIKDVAKWFRLEEQAVVKALRYYAVQGDRLRASGEVVRP